MLSKLRSVPKAGTPLVFEFEDKLRLFTFATGCLLLTLRLDGWKAGNLDTLIQIGLIPLSLLFIFCVVVFLWPGRFKTWLERHLPKVFAWVDRWDTARLIIATGFVFEIITFGLLVVQVKVFGRFGYDLNPVLAGALFVLLAAGFGWCWFSTRRLEVFFFFVLAAYSLVALLSIISFPLALGRSDMLPIMTLSNQNLLDGHNPYDRQFSTIPETGNYLDYFPANVLFYFPSTLFKFDPRLMNLACVLLVAVILYKTVERQARLPVLSLLSLWLLCPFFQFRHDLYEVPEWLLLTLFVLSLRGRRPLLAGFVLGTGLTLTPFNFVLVPFFLLYLWRTYNFRKAVLSLVPVALGVLLFVGPFLVWSASTFVGSLVNGLDRKAVLLFTPSVNLAYVVYQVVPLRFAKLIQTAVVLAALFMAGRKMRTLADCLSWMTLGLLLFIALNTYINGYFYFFIAFLLILQRFALEEK